MKVKKLQIDNFLSFGKGNEIVLSDYGQLTLVKGELSETEGSNGAGKSSLFEAIFWCLTGKTVRGVKAADVVRIGASSVKVTMTITINKKEIEIERIWSAKAKTVVISAGEDIERFHDSKQGTARIFEILNIKPEILSLICFYGRKFNTFSDLSPKERAEVVDMLAQGQRWEKGRDKAAKQVKEFERDYTSTKTTLDELTSEAQGITEVLEQLNEQFKEFTQRQNKLITIATEAVDEAKKEADKIQKEAINEDNLTNILETNAESRRKLEASRDEAITHLKGKQASRDDIASTGLNEIREMITGIATMISEEKNNKRLNQSSIEDAQKEKGATNCTKCGQKLLNPPDNDKIDGEIRNLTIASKACDDELADCAEDMARLSQQERDINANIRKGADTLMNDVREEEKAVEAKLDKLIAMDNEAKASVESYHLRRDNQLLVVKNAEEQLLALHDSTEKAVIEANIVTHSDRITATTNKIDTTSEKILEIANEIQLSKYWKQGFKDLRFGAFENTIKTLEKLLNAFCSQQGLDFDNIEVTAHKENAAGKITPELNIYVVRDGNRMGIDALSEGETQRIDLACFFTFSILIEKSLGFKVEFNVLDEPLSGLDYEGRQKVFNIISEISHSKQVFVVDHNANFQDLFNNIITVNKKKGISSIQEEQC